MSPDGKYLLTYCGVAWDGAMYWSVLWEPLDNMRRAYFETLRAMSRRGSVIQ
jgi:hypothetical protein